MGTSTRRNGRTDTAETSRLLCGGNEQREQFLASIMLRIGIVTLSDNVVLTIQEPGRREQARDAHSAFRGGIFLSRAFE